MALSVLDRPLPIGEQTGRFCAGIGLCGIKKDLEPMPVTAGHDKDVVAVHGCIRDQKRLVGRKALRPATGGRACVGKLGATLHFGTHNQRSGQIGRDIEHAPGRAMDDPEFILAREISDVITRRESELMGLTEGDTASDRHRSDWPSSFLAHSDSRAQALIAWTLALVLAIIRVERSAWADRSTIGDTDLRRFTFASVKADLPDLHALSGVILLRLLPRR
ncbi:hypothetical protein [Devosia salina]|uniref:Uncharacterized protein n=1 Tax=Devosia salina TaxID=2860336 RepID=A0ABX8WKT3_9HYPH|nr:hypothetical protein [Devosia salina]QYO77302.1 hypothetical protein K1X15_01575 [Devosia salina]